MLLYIVQCTEYSTVEYTVQLLYTDATVYCLKGVHERKENFGGKKWAGSRAKGEAVVIRDRGIPSARILDSLIEPGAT